MDTPRRFGIADGLILIAGVAAGLGFAKAISPEVTPLQIWEAITHSGARSPRMDYSGVLTEIAIVFLGPFLAILTPFVLLLHLMKPRPPWRRLRRQPGFVACLMATVVSLSTIAFSAFCFRNTAMETVRSTGGLMNAQLVGGLAAGVGSVSGWFAMRLNGVCRPRPTWTDRLGRLIGLAWLTVAIACSYLISNF